MFRPNDWQLGFSTEGDTISGSDTVGGSDTGNDGFYLPQN